MSNGITPLTPEQTAEQEKEVAKVSYFHRLGVEVDILGNVVTGGLNDETISSRSARAAERGSKFGIVITKFLNLFQSNHGAKAQAGDVERATIVITAENESGGINK